MTDEEKRPYHNIMVAAWRLFIKDREPEKFTDAWWKDVFKDYDKLRELYKKTIYDQYCCHVSQAFLDELERIQKRNKSQEYIQCELPFSAEDWNE